MTFLKDRHQPVDSCEKRQQADGKTGQTGIPKTWYLSGSKQTEIVTRTGCAAFIGARETRKTPAQRPNICVQLTFCHHVSKSCPAVADKASRCDGSDANAAGREGKCQASQSMRLPFEQFYSQVRRTIPQAVRTGYEMFKAQASGQSRRSAGKSILQRQGSIRNHFFSSS